MTKLLLGAAAAVAIAAIAPASAQPAPPPPAAAPQVQVPALRTPMRAQTRDQVVLRVREKFGQLDANRDGFLTREEVAAARQARAGARRVRIAHRLANRSPADRGAAFDRIDANRDGMISRQEFVSAKPQAKTRVIRMRDGEGAAGIAGAPGQRRVKMMHMRRMGLHGRRFETADANRDGRVSLQELTDSALQRFDGTDLNRDGRITPEERTQRRQRVRAQRVQS